jgi:hypothetical protein
MHLHDVIAVKNLFDLYATDAEGSHGSPVTGDIFHHGSEASSHDCTLDHDGLKFALQAVERHLSAEEVRASHVMDGSDPDPDDGFSFLRFLGMVAPKAAESSAVVHAAVAFDIGAGSTEADEAAAELRAAFCIQAFWKIRRPILMAARTFSMPLHDVIIIKHLFDEFDAQHTGRLDRFSLKFALQAVEVEVSAEDVQNSVVWDGVDDQRYVDSIPLHTVLCWS